MKHLGDITKINGRLVEPTDVVIGGSPCQDLSVAGKREGLAGERSGLFMEQIRIVKEMRKEDRERGRADHLCRPRFMVWENVPGAFSSRGGTDFGAVLEEIVHISEPEAPAVPMPQKGWPTSGCLMGDGWSVAWRVLDAQFWGVPQRRRRIALVADFGGRAAPEILFEREGVRRYPAAGGAERETDAAGAEDGAGEASGYGETGAGYWQRGIQCLRAEGENRPSRPSNVICMETEQDNLVFENHGQDSRLTGLLDTAPTVAQKFGSGGNNTPLVVASEHTVMKEDDIAGTLDASYYKGPGMRSGVEREIVRTGRHVRRLTPMECERLQGFPDGWTDIGQWTDSKGKLHKASSDSSRYKALGNSIAIPPWKWVLKRLCAHFERDATMASLFDGIGGFPYIWEQLNGEGTCLWASEIEEFPIAVTKYHFRQEDDHE